MFLKFLMLLVLKYDSKECSHGGVFPIPYTACKGYKICSEFGARTYDCPATTLFDPRAQNCVLNFICPETDICPYLPEGLYADPNYLSSSKFYIECVKGVLGWMVRYGQCGENETFESSPNPPYAGSCQRIVDITTEEQTTTTTTTTEAPLNDTTTESTTPPTTTPSPLPTLAPIPSPYCQEEGIFPLYHTDCAGYMVCQTSGTSFNQYNYRCSPASLFDPWQSKCVSGYQCLEHICINEPHGSLLANTNDITKTQYFLCVLDGIGSVIPLYLECPTGQIFDDVKKTCAATKLSLPNPEKEDTSIMSWLSSQFKWLFGMGQ